MKIAAKDILAEDQSYKMRIIDPLEFANRDRAQKLARIKENAKDFAEDFLLEVDLPTAPTVHVGNIKGFETRKDINQTSGYILVRASFKTLSGVKVNLDLPVPISRGYFYVPSIMKVGYDVKLFSKEAVGEIVDSLENLRPQLNNSIFDPQKDFSMMENVEEGMFDVPPSLLDDKMLGLNYY